MLLVWRSWHQWKHDTHPGLVRDGNGVAWGDWNEAVTGAGRKLVQDREGLGLVAAAHAES